MHINYISFFSISTTQGSLYKNNRYVTLRYI